MGNGGFSETCLMFSVAILNLICGVLGALIFCLAIWMRLEIGVRDWIRELELFQYWNGLYILMVAGAIILIIAFLGCCGALTNNIPLMTIKMALAVLTCVMLLFGAGLLLGHSVRPSFDYVFVTDQFNLLLGRKDSRSDNFMIWLSYVGTAAIFVAIILELAGGILILVHGTQASKLQPSLTTTLDRLILDSNYNPTSNYYLNTVQEKVGCCGSRSYMDYTRNNLPISDSCRDAISGNVIQQGCVQKFSVFIEKRAGWIAAISITVALLQILLICITFCHIRVLRGSDENRSKGKYYGVPQN